MRITIIIVLGLVTLGSFAALQPVFAATKCVPVNCHTYHGVGGPRYSCQQRCTSEGPRAPQTIQDQKNKRMK